MPCLGGVGFNALMLCLGASAISLGAFLLGLLFILD